MKHIFSTVILAFLVLSSFGQEQLMRQSIGLQFNDDHIGRNLNLTYRKGIQKWAVYGGIKYHLNSNVHDNAGHSYMKRFYAEEFHQHFGLKLGIERTFSLKTNSSELYAFYDFQFTRAITKATDYYPAAYDTAGNLLYKEHVSLFGPVNAFENTLGIGGRFKIKGPLYFTAFIGGSVIYITHGYYDPKHKTIVIGGNRNWEFSRMFGVGIEYKLK